MTLDEVKQDIELHCDQMLTCFKPGAQITVIVVNDLHGDAGLVISSGDLKRAAEEIKRRLAASETIPADENNWDKCLRIARGIDQTHLIQCLLKRIHELTKNKRPKRELWAHISDAINHGSGVSSAVCVHYLGEGGDV